MRKGPQKSLFPASVFTISTVVVVSFLAQGLRSSVPRIGANTLRVGTEDYLRAAEDQGIPWQPLTEEVFREAKLRDKPILLICGDAMDRTAQLIDKQVFGDREVTAWLKTGFICVRVDLAQHPEWRDVYLQVERGRAQLNPNWQGYILLPSGKTFSRILTSTTRQLDSRWFLQTVRSGLQTFREIQRGASRVVAGEAQAKERDFLVGSPPTPPDLSGFGDYLVEYFTSLNGAGPTPGHVLPATQQIHFLFLAGRTSEAMAMLDRILASPMTDWIDGGVFQQALTMDLKQVAFQKSAVRVADFLHVCTLAYVRTRDPIYRYAAELAFSCLDDQMRLGDFVRGTQFADMGPDQHSPIYSVTFREIRQALTPAERETLYEFFPLNERMLPQQSLVLKDVRRASARLDDLRAVLAKLRAGKRGMPRRFGAEQQADVAGISAARMLRAARLLEDEKMATRALELQEGLDSFLAGDSVLHSLRVLNEGHSTLKDSLAYADAMLEQYLLSGNVQSLQRGLAVLTNALDEFRGPRDGVLVNWKPSDPENWPPDIAVPGLVDSFGESSVAMAIRLTNNYGRIMGALAAPDFRLADAERLEKFATSSVLVFGAPAMRVGWAAAGYFCAAWRVSKGAVVLVKDPLSLDKATALSRRIPHRFVAPLIGELKPNWKSKPDGCYILRSEGMSGPLSMDEVAAELGG